MITGSVVGRLLSQFLDSVDITVSRPCRNRVDTVSRWSSGLEASVSFLFDDAHSPGGQGWDQSLRALYYTPRPIITLGSDASCVNFTVRLGPFSMYNTELRVLTYFSRQKSASKQRKGPVSSDAVNHTSV